MDLLLGLMILMAQQSAASGTPRMNLEPLRNAIKSFDGAAGLAARNLLNGEEIFINADQRFPTASVIETAVMVEAYHQGSRGTLSLDTTIPLSRDRQGGRLRRPQ